MFLVQLLPTLLPALALAAPSVMNPAHGEPYHSATDLSGKTAGHDHNPHHDAYNPAHDPYPSGTGLSEPAEQVFNPAHDPHPSLAGLSNPVKHEVKKGHKKGQAAESVTLQNTSPITLTSDMGPIKAYNRGLFVNANKKTGSICNKNLTDVWGASDILLLC